MRAEDLRNDLLKRLAKRLWSWHDPCNLYDRSALSSLALCVFVRLSTKFQQGVRPFKRQSPPAFYISFFSQPRTSGLIVVQRETYHSFESDRSFPMDVRECNLSEVAAVIGDVI